MDSQGKSIYDDDYQIETLHWCIPCYFNYFFSKFQHEKKVYINAYSSLKTIFGWTIGIYILLLLFTWFFFINFYLDQFSSNLISLFYIFWFFYLFIHRFRMFSKKEIKLIPLKNDFLISTYQRVIDTTILCYWCKEKIKHSDATCLNIQCTLGEEIDLNAQLIPLYPIKYLSNLFESLAPLPKNPDEYFNENDLNQTF